MEGKLYLPGDPMCDALFKGAAGKRNQNKMFREGPIEIQPGHLSTDHSILTFKDILSRRLTDMFPAEVDEMGRVSGNGVRSNFYGLRHVNGYPMRPATFPLMDNMHLRESVGLSNRFTQKWHEVVFEAIIRLFFSDLEPSKLRLRKGSSSMMPWFTTDMEQKKELAYHSISNAEKACGLMEKGDTITAWGEYYIGGGYQTVYRRQSSDAVDLDNGVFVSKDRPVADQEFARTGGRKGTFNPASKDASDIEAKIPEGFFRERNRTAKGGPLGTNTVLMTIAQPLRDRLYRKYAYSLHHTTRDSIQADLRDWSFTIAADVSNHDWYWPTFFLDKAGEILKNMGFAEWFCHLYVAKGKLPDYVTDVDVGKGNVLQGSWTEPNNTGGLHSGNAFTDIEGTYGMLFVYFLIQVEHTAPELIPLLQDVSSAMSVLDRYLKGQLSIKIKDKSDDALLGWTDPAKLSSAKALQEKMKNGDKVSDYMVVGYEHGGAFLGSILLYPKSGENSDLVLIGNIQSMVINEFSPEYGVQSNIRDRSKVKRPFPGLAWASMQQVYGTSPIYGEVRDVIEKTWSYVYGESYNAYRDKMLIDDMEKLRRYVRQFENVGLPDLTTADIEVLADPDKLQYKYNPDEINPEVVDLLFQGLTLEQIEPFFNKITPR